MKDFIYQIDKKECGYACVKMLLAAINKNENFLYLPRTINENTAYSLFELITFAKQHGLFLAGYQIKGLATINSERAPFIYVKTLADNTKHAILVKKKWRYFAYIYDPAYGKKLMRLKKAFNDCELGAEILSVESSQNVSLNIIAPKLINSKDQATIILVNIMSFASFFLGAYFINDNSYTLLPIIFIIFGVLFAIIHRVYTYKTMQKFDQEYIAYTFDNDINKRERNYRLMHQVKSGLFTNYSRFIISLFTALAINLILILKDNRTIIILIVSLLFALFDNFIITPITYKKREEIAQLEQHLLSKETRLKEDYLNKYKQIKESTYSIAKRFDYKRITFYFLLLLMVFIMGYITNQVSVYFVLFYFMTAVLSYDNFVTAFKISDENKDNIINQTKFIHLLLNKKKD